MGYDCKVALLNREEVDRWKNRCPDMSISELYSEVLWSSATDIWSSSQRYLSKEIDYLDTLGNDSVYEFSEKEWKDLILKLEEKIKGILFYDLTVKEDISICQMEELTQAYSVFKYLSVDFEKTSIIFEHDW